MWAALPVEPLKPWPPSLISTTTTTSARRRFVVVRNTKEMSGGIKSDDRRLHRNAVKSETSTKSPSGKEEQEKQLSGSDVLMALQRATAQKSARKSKQKNQVNSAARETHDGGGDISSSSNSKPLRIKAEWSDRLQELERRLEELAHG